MEFTVNIDLNMEGFKEIEKACTAISKSIEVGILHNPKEAQIGYLQHYGGTGVYQYGEHEGESVDIPPRPFIMAPVDEFGGTILQQSAKKHFKFTEDSANKTLDIAGKTMAEDIKYWMDRKGAYPPDNSERTIETKGFNHPLIDKGTLRDSVEYEVVK